MLSKHLLQLSIIALTVLSFFVPTMAQNGNNYINTSSTICQGETVQPTVLSCPANITLTTLTNCVASTWAEPTFSDNCTSVIDLDVSMTSFPSSLTNGACFPLGTTTINYTVLDLAGNAANCIFRITVTKDPCFNENIAPVLSGCPADMNLSSTTSCKAITWTVPTATDNCSTPSVTLAASTAGLINGSCFPVGTTTMIYTATDANNNTSTCSFNIAITLQQIGGGGGGIAPPPPPTTNIINAGGFEFGLAGFNNLGNLTTTTNAYSGSVAAMIATNGAGGVGFTQAAIPNQTYTFKSWNKISSSSISSNALVGIKFFDANMNLISGASSVSQITTTSFQEKTLTLVAPANAAFVQIYALKNISTGTLTTDNWTLTATNTCYATFDPTKSYRIVNRGSGKHLKVSNASYDDDAPTVQGDWTGEANQIWTLKSLNNGYHDCVVKHSGKSLSNKSNERGSGCKQKSYENDYTNDWKFECLDNGYYRITHRSSNLCMENYQPNEGCQSSLYDWDGGTYQQWSVEECSTSNGSFSVVKNNNPTNNSINKFESGITSAERYKDEANRYARLHQRPSALKTGKLVAFPNPANEVANVDLSAYAGKAVQLSLFNGFGQPVLTKNIASANTDLVEMDVTGLPVGTYLIKAQISGLRDITQMLIVGK